MAYHPDDSHPDLRAYDHHSDKEVQGYFEDGMQVPDDVILLWTDDNWGNIRRFPLVSERNRTGGAGVYYHVSVY